MSPSESKLDTLLQRYSPPSGDGSVGCHVPAATTEQNASRESDEEFERQLDKKKRTAVHQLWVILVWGFAILAALVALIIVWHWVAPEKWRWLTKEDVCSVTSYFAACGGGVILRSVASKI